MSLSQSKTWVKQDLQSLIDNQVQENSGLDYKDSRALQKSSEKKIEIAKDVSSFANSGGGIIVYGICEDNDNHFPEMLDDGVNPTEFSKEWLENVIQGNLRPPIQGLHINQVALKESSVGNVAYVVTIPQSVTAHQVQGHHRRYFKRYNFSAQLMEHYEILDVLNRNRYPYVIPTFEIPGDYEEISNRRSLRIFLENQGSVSAKAIKLILYWPSVFKFDKYEIQPDRLAWKGPNSSGTDDSKEYSVYVKERVLFPEEKVLLEDLLAPAFAFRHFRALPRNHSESNKSIASFRGSELVLGWKIFADDMPPKMGNVSLNKIFKEEDFFFYEN